MSGATKSNKGGSNNSFETYRQIAPETLDDQRLKDIIKNNKNDHDAIVLAIEHIWHDTPDQKAVGSEWVTTSKAKKQDTVPVKSSRDAGRRETGGRGGAGRGRSLPPAGGRGGGDGRGAPRASSVRAPTGRESPAVRASPTVAEQENEAVEDVEPVAAEPAAPAAVAAAAPVAAGGVAWGRGASLAQKLKEAEKQKEVEKVKVDAPVKVEEEAPASTHAAAADVADAQKAGKSGRGRRPRGASAGAAPAAEKRGAEDAVADLADATESLAVEEKVEAVVVAAAEVPPPPPLVQVAPAAVAAPVEVPVVPAPEVVAAPASSAQQGFLNMGKWEAPVESADISAFQFGSFGNVYGEDDSASSGVSASQVGTNPSAAPWTGLHSAEDNKSSSSSSNVWGTPSEQSLDISGGLFAQQASSSSGGSSSAINKVEASADVNLAAGNVAATRAPPGLAQNKGNNNSSSTATTNNAARPVGQQAKKAETTPQQSQQQAQLPVYHQQQQAQQQQPNYSQQGVPPGMNNNRNPLGLNPLGGGLPYPYNPSFDLLAAQQQAAYGGYPLGGPQVPPLAPASAAAASSGSSTTSSAATGASSTANAAPNAALAQQQAAQAQQYAQQAPFPYYPNPYYPNQAAYYYGQHQMPNFYGQGRDMYQQRGPYGNNPYGGAGSLYPGDVYGQQQGGAGQFPDASGSYGGLPVHPGMQGGANNAAGASSAGNKAAKGANAGNSAGAVGGANAAQQGINPDQHTANLLMNSGYGYVNPYSQPRDGGWQQAQQQQQQGGYPGSQAGGWPMMYPGSSAPSSLGGVGAGFAPQQGNAGAAQQGQQGQGNNNRGNNNNNNTYGNNAFGGRGAGGAAPAPAGGVTQNCRGSLDPGSMGYTGPEVSAPTHRFKDRTTRITDPNNPQYHINGMDYADDKYTKPKVQKGYIADNHLLQTKDITGAAPGFKDTRFVRREIRNINYIADIEGAHADSIKHSIVTNRQSNPLAPVYQSLDPGELLQPVVPPLIPPSMVKVPTVPVERGNRPKEPEQTHGISFGASVPVPPQYDDYDPVSFATTAPESSKPPSGRFQLDFSGGGGGGGVYGGFGGGSGRKNQEGSPYGSARGQQPAYGGGSGSGGRSRLGNAAANTFNASGGSYFNDTGSSGMGSGRGYSGGNGGNKTLSFQSPSPSARGGGNSGRLTPQERRAYLERSAEINSVRDLRQ